jgi:hypothetical protein
MILGTFPVLLLFKFLDILISFRSCFTRNFGLIDSVSNKNPVRKGSGLVFFFKDS